MYGQIDRRTIIRLAAIVLACLLVILFHIPATADRSGACTYSGTVKVDNGEVADGTLVTAIIAGDKYHTHTSTGYGYSTYSITVRTPAGKVYPDGTEVTFKVSGHPTGQTAAFKSGANVRLDLAASTNSTLSSSSIAIISSIVLALLAAGAAAYYFLLRRRGVRIADWLKARGAAPSGQVPPLTVDDEGQPVSRYIWDNAKLAWVESIQQAKSKPTIRQPVKSSVRANAPAKAGTGVAQPVGQGTPVTVKFQEKAIVQKKAVPAISKDATDKQERPVLYNGAVELVLPPPMAMGRLYRFSNSLRGLRNTYHIRVAALESLPGHAMCMKLLLQNPLPLIRILEALPEVDSVSDELKNPRGIYLGPHLRDRSNNRRIVVKLKA